jgi:hypothetical protein
MTVATSRTFLYYLFCDNSMTAILFYLFVVCLSFLVCRTIEAPMFDILQDLEEQDFEQLVRGKCP